MSREGASPLPPDVASTLWDLDLETLDVHRDADAILARILEHGSLEEVRWVLRTYGDARVRAFFEAGPHPITSERTRGFWAAYFRPETPWPRRSDSRSHSSAPWID